MPDQSLICSLRHKGMFDDELGQLRFRVNYKWNGKAHAKSANDKI